MKARARKPLVTSVNVLRGLAAGITMLSLAGMTAFAGGHLYNASAPLQPSAATAAPVITSTTTGRLQLSRTVTTTSTSRAVTKTHHS